LIDTKKVNTLENTYFTDIRLVAKGGCKLISGFMNLETKKRERIINTGLSEFAQKGYRYASTNQITNKAGIAKGMLFHYFGSKKGMYLFLCDYSVNIIVNEYYQKFDMNERDIIRRLLMAAQIKFEILKKHPDMYGFMLKMITEDSLEVIDEISDKSKILSDEGHRKINENMDTSLFKDGINSEVAADIITWTIQGFSNLLLERLKSNPADEVDYQKISTEYDIYIGLLKMAFYKCNHN
jgi:AcrR family transcriptional regulator